MRRASKVTIEALCGRLADPSARVKYASAKALRALSERSPEDLYPRFDFFVRLLDSEYAILRWNAAHIIANLASVDRQGRIDKRLDRLLAPILGKELIGAANTIQASAMVALAKPHLAGRIADEILKVT